MEERSNSGEVIQIEVPAHAGGERLDRFLPPALAERAALVSRAVLQSLIRDGGVTVNQKAVKPRHPVSAGDVIRVNLVPERQAEPLAEQIDLAVLFEDEDIIVVDKPPGLVVHPAAGNLDGTLVNALLHHCGGKLSRSGGDDRPGIVHRLDKDTSGCLVAAKSDAAYLSLVSQFSGRETGKEYIAVTDGVPARSEGTISNRIGRHPVNRQKMSVLSVPAGKEAVTDYRVLRSEASGRWASILCVIHTGRTHQIRVHLKESLGCPILGDPIYAQIPRQPEKVDRLMLHAWHLAFKHPVSGEPLSFEAPLPDAFLRFV